jgi:cell volume regulation protein A
VFCVVVTAAAVRVAVGGAAGPGEAAMALGTSFAIGLGVGGAAGFPALLALRGLHRSEHTYPLLLGTLLVLYVLIDHLGGSAPLGILAVAVLVGNAPALSKIIGLVDTARLSKGVEQVHDQVTFIVKSFFFTFIGAMLSPPWGLIGLGAILGGVLLVARVPAVLGATLGARYTWTERGIVTAALPRGMAAGVLAMLPAQAGIEGTEQLPVVVFAAVFTTILLFAAGFPFFKRRLLSEPRTPVQRSPEAQHRAPAKLAEATRENGGVPPSQDAAMAPELVSKGARDREGSGGMAAD